MKENENISNEELSLAFKMILDSMANIVKSKDKPKDEGNIKK